MNKQYKDKEWIKGKYIDEKLSITEISKLYQMTRSPIIYWMKKFDIPRRSSGEGVHLIRANHCKLATKAISWINGELLGDCYLQSTSSYAARIRYSSKHLEYCEYVRDTLESFGIKQASKIHKTHLTDRGMDCYVYLYVSLSYVELSNIRKKWYPEGKKIVPKDFRLTPLTCRQWYIGDGSLKHYKKQKQYIILATCGFMVIYVEWLVKQLIKMGFKVTRQVCDNTIRISVYSTKDFLDYIGKCPVKCYQYKFNYVKE